MAATITIVLTVPVFFPFEHWMSSDEDVTKPSDVVQIDATVIIGILIFLTINASTNGAQNQEVSAKALFNPTKIINLSGRVLIAALTTLTIIPFALSSIIILIWGHGPVRKLKNTPTTPENKPLSQASAGPENEIKTQFFYFFPSNEMIANLMTQHKVTGVKLGVTFMMAGFTWIIISMIVFATIVL
ncbi:MAG TPA: hypothetical protein VN922_04620 [Bacteroidia bacterium]|nr:hypothetical protein [Bacteroidia bacterium]